MKICGLAVRLRLLLCVVFSLVISFLLGGLGGNEIVEGLILDDPVESVEISWNPVTSEVFLMEADEPLLEINNEGAEIEVELVEVSEIVWLGDLEVEDLGDNSDLPVSNRVTERVPNSSVEFSLGVFTLTAYCDCILCCDEWSWEHPRWKGTEYVQTSASGRPLIAGRTVAADPRVLPFGTIISINGFEYVVEDMGGGVLGRHIDIFMNSHEEALHFGWRTAEVFLQSNNVVLWEVLVIADYIDSLLEIDWRLARHTIKIDLETVMAANEEESYE